MRRWAIGSVAFFLTLGIGVSAAWFFLRTNQTIETNGNPPVAEPVVEPVGNATNSSDHLSEFFTDESRIGRAGKNKIVVNCFERGGEMVAEIKFYSRSNNARWEQKQSFEFKKDGLTGCDPEIKDFNNDGLKDFTYQSNVAARGANVIRTLFIYDPKKDELLYVKNSESYPNMLYNEKLDCIDSWMFHGATTTVFLKIEGDMLKEFASVDTGAELVVKVTTEIGEREIRRKTMSLDDIYTRYISFDPPIPYK